MKSPNKIKIINVLNIDRCVQSTDTNIISICFILKDNKHKIYDILHDNRKGLIKYIKNLLKDDTSNSLTIELESEPDIIYKISNDRLLNKFISILEDAKYSNKVFEKINNKLRMSFKASIFSLENKEVLLTITELDEYFINHEFKMILSFNELPIKQNESIVNTANFYINESGYLLTNSQNYAITVYMDVITKPINSILRKLAKYIQNEFGNDILSSEY